MAHFNGSTTTSVKGYEQTVLAAFAANTDLLYKAKLRPHMFYNAAHREIFLVIDNIGKKSKDTRVTAAQVVHRAMQKQAIGLVGGEAYVQEILNQKFSDIYIVNAIKAIRDAALERKTVDGLQGLTVNVRGKSTDEIMAACNEVMRDLFKDEVGDKGETAREILEKVKAKHEQFAKGGNAGLVEMGIPPLDHRLNGLDPVGYVVIAADSGTGKSGIGCAVMHSFLKKGKKFLFVSTEMKAERVMPRLLTIESGINATATSRGSMTAHEKARFDAAGERLVDMLDAHGEIYYKSGMSIDDLISRALAFARQHGRIDGILVDYIQNIEVPGPKGVEATYKAGLVSKRLYELANDLDCVVFGLSQVTIDSTKPELTTNSVRDSKNIKQDADVIILVTKKEDMSARSDRKNLIEFNIAKMRDGEGGGKVEALFNSSYMKFEWINGYAPDHFTTGSVPFDAENGVAV